MSLPRRLGADQPEAELRRWRVVRLDGCVTLAGEIIEADADSGVAKMRERGPDKLLDDGTVQRTWEIVIHSLGPGAIAIVGK
jgi:hypothetical protein